MRNVKLTLCAMALAAVSTSALAAGETQGTVTFNGKLTNDTCTIAADSVNRIVDLPTVSVQTLDAAEKEAGSKGFDLNVENCPSGVTEIAAHFEAIGSTGVNSATGNLVNTATTTPAENVEVRLYNSDEAQLKLGETGAFAKVDAATHTATMRYYGGYYATAATKAGTVYAQAKYTLAYK